MPFPVVAVVVVGLLGGAALALRGDAAKKTDKPATVDPSKPTVITKVPKVPVTDKNLSGCQFEDDIQPLLRTQVEALLKKPHVPPEALEAFAVQVDMAGFPMAAECLRKRAAEIRAAAMVAWVAQGGMPFHIRSGDIPVNVAQWYTGDASFARLMELGALNANVLGTWGMLPGGIQGWPGWQVSRTILIPLSWNPQSKPLPPVATGSSIPPTGGLAPGVQGVQAQPPVSAVSPDYVGDWASR